MPIWGSSIHSTAVGYQRLSRSVGTSRYKFSTRDLSSTYVRQKKHEVDEFLLAASLMWTVLRAFLGEPESDAG